MDITTSRFGTITVQEDKLIHFPRGILGFANSREFILFPHSDSSPFYWLQCVNDGDIAFVVMDPRLVKPDYSVDIEESIINELDAEGLPDLDVMCIVTIPAHHPEKMTINLLGPIIINVNKRNAVQIVCPEEHYSHRHPIIAAREG